MTLFRRLVHPILLVCLFLGLVGGLSANAGKPKKTPPPQDPRILVTAVDLPNKQITVVFKRTGQKTVYTIDDLTQVTFQNSPGSLKDVKVGQQIFSYVERDDHTLDSVTIGAADPAPTVPKDK